MYKMTQKGYFMIKKCFKSGKKGIKMDTFVN